MQWKKIFYAIVLTSPLAASAQGPRINSDGKRLAMLESSERAESNNNKVNAQKAHMDSMMAAKALPFTMNGNGKVISGTPASEVKSKNTNVADNRKAQELPPAAASVKPIAKEEPRLAALRPSERVYEANDKFKAVPLAGETDYYGNMNGYMVNYVKNYMGHFSQRLISINGRSECFTTIDRVLKQYSIPKELKYLAVIESALLQNARSPVGAVGYWQFMESTARLMGLTVNGRRDERKDLTRSTQAAAKYLSYLYDQLDDWLLVVAAYNSGPRPVVNAMKRTGKDDFWSIKSYLPKETQNHVLAFVATATIMERLNHFLLPGMPANFDWALLNSNRGEAAAKDKKFAHPLLSKFSEEEVKKMAMVRIKTPLDLELVAATLSIDRRMLGKWNYDYFDFLDTYKAGNTYNFRIPKEKLDAFIEKKDYLERASANMQL
ncbi:lytic transglycosylase domain-containing protein [Taibaiella chishuiensis]|uniref:Transglycosylase-like protein with SLT domain n=1 Tax=Taibaiella chishuiensis TaxID=1434707 RepID=A0A2P8CWK1_9BACT|nr:lytic transglycosylase domain-containing protein [Taibaiella chishuiensis]PSK89362.1 transglycosylase-like protein with SLT domain [Taibaiella chishuiensis]